MEDLRTALADRYRIERELGAGGMATVYLAQDLRHDRSVAIKVLHPHLAAALGTERFLAEIRTTARLHHAHVLPLFDSGEAAGQLFYVMPFVTGETLRERLNRERSLAIDEALRLAREVADALAYAHSQGVVHRDIKPENILLSSGHAFVADFGIARAVSVAAGDRITQTGVAIGTPAYMSPEQMLAERETDGRTDIYSLGCVLFEMLTAEPPFLPAPNAALLVQRLTRPAPTVISKRSDVPTWLNEVVQRAMARESSDRFQTAEAFAHSLTVAHSSGTERSVSLPCIAVLPFTNMSADPDAEYFSDGMSEEILSALVSLPGLRVIARTSSFAFKGKSVDVREIGERLRAGLILEGSVRKAGNRVRITAQLIDATTGHHLWSDRYDRDLIDVFAIQDEITASIRDALRDVLVAQTTPPQRKPPPIDSATYDLFLRAKFQLARLDGMQRGMEYLEQVRAKAPAFAPACAEQAFGVMILTWYMVLPPREGFPRARALAEQALALDPNSARATFVLGQVALYHDWNLVQAVKHSDRSLVLDPSDALAHVGRCYIHASQGQFDDVRRLLAVAVSVDPLNPSVRSWSAILFWMARDLDRVLSASNEALELDSTHSQAHRFKGHALVELGRQAEGLESLHAAVLHSGRDVNALTSLAVGLARVGHLDEAERLLNEHLALQRSTLVSPINIAYILAAMKRIDSAFEWLEKAIDVRDHWLTMLRVEPWFDDLRDDPRFDAFVTRVGISA